MERYAYQWKYTSCRYNIEKADGFRTFSKSYELTEAEQEELSEIVAHYDVPEASSRLPSTPDELNDRTKYPIAFTSFKLTNGKSVICRVRYAGKEYDGSRSGNFFAHALVLSEGAWEKPIRYFDSPTFADGLRDFEINLGETPDPLWAIPLSCVEIRSANKPELSHATRALVDGFVAALRRRQNLVVIASPENLANAAKHIVDLLACLPAEIATKIEFTTYSRNPTNEPLFKRAKYLFLAFAPRESARYVEEGEAVVVDLDAALQEKLKLSELYALTLPTSLELSRGLPQAKVNVAESLRSEVDFDLNDGRSSASAAPDERTLDLQRLNRAAIISAMENNYFPQIEGNFDVWTTLSDDERTIPDKRWLATWRLLKDRPLNFQLEVAQKLLKLDLCKQKRNEATCQNLTRHILAYAVRVWDRLAEPRDDRKTLKRSIIDFWTRSIPGEDEAFKNWRDALPQELATVFASDGPAALAFGGGASNLAENFFDFNDRDSLKADDFRAPWLVLAFSFAVFPKIVDELSVLQRATASETREQAAAFSLATWLELTLKINR